MADERQALPHEPAYFRQKAEEMHQWAQAASNEPDRQAFLALAEQWLRLAETAERRHP